jgi:hypothetical protein
MGKLIKGALIGGIVVFVWGMLSHMLLPWHEAGFVRFTDEEVVGNALKSQTSGSGMYLYPMGPECGPDATAEELKAKEDAMEKWAVGPSAFIVYHEGSWNMTAPLIRSLIINFITAFLIMALLLSAPNLTFWGKVLFVMIAAVAGSMAVFLQYWNWWSFASSYTLVNIADAAIGWFLAGLAMAKWGVPKET